VLQCEQAPNPENRVILGSETDSLGMRRARVIGRRSAIDLESIRQTRSIFLRAFENSNLARLVPAFADDELEAYPFANIHHHMGTTRMHRDPSCGVVDENCMLYGTSNVFLAGNSVLPTGGCANPTLTMLALTLRLADHISARFAIKPQLVNT
jgi:choline dehydrogenase-like flavoprotein